MFLDWLDNLRKKPKEVRIQYAFAGAAGVTGIIVLFWLVSLPTHLQERKIVEETGTGSFGALLQKMREGTAQVFSNTPPQQPLLPQEENEEEAAYSAPVPIEALLTSSTTTSTPIRHTPPPRTVLIGTTSADKKATTTAR